MPLVTVKNKFQIVIPQDLRRELGIRRGDLLEVKAERGKLTYTPKAVVDRIPKDKAERERFFTQLRADAPKWLREMWTASKRRGTGKLSKSRIDNTVAAARRQRSENKSR
jgi:AbrB family looped-hinge helix DNA binding protein